MKCETLPLTIDPFPTLLLPTCAQCAGIGLHGIPAMLWDMEDACGEAALFAFLLAYGGREYIGPVEEPAVRDGDPLSIARHWVHGNVGHGKMTLPLGPAAYRRRLAWTIFDRLSKGHSRAQISQELRLTTRSVSIHRNRLRRIGALPSNASDQRSDQ